MKTPTKVIAAAATLILILVGCTRTPTPEITETVPSEDPEAVITLLTDADVDGAVEMLASLERELAVAEIDNLGTGEELGLLSEQSAELSPQATVAGVTGYLIWIDHRPSANSPWRIVVQNQSGGPKIFIYRGKREIDSVAIDRHGTNIAMSLRQSATNPTSDFEIYEFDTVAGLPLVRRTNNGNDDTDVSLSSDGSILVWEAGSASNRRVKFRVGGSTTIIANNDQELDPSIDPSGNFIAWINLRANGDTRVQLFDIGAATVQNLTTFSAVAKEHASPTNRGKHVFWLQRSTPNRIKRRVVAGGTRTVATGANLGHPHASFDPDLFTYTTEDGTPNSEVFTKRISTNTVAQATNTPGSRENFAPYWFTRTARCIFDNPLSLFDAGCIYK